MWASRSLLGVFVCVLRPRSLIQWFSPSTAMKWTFDLDGLTEGGFAGWEA